MTVFRYINNFSRESYKDKLYIARARGTTAKSGNANVVVVVLVVQYKVVSIQHLIHNFIFVCVCRCFRMYSPVLLQLFGASQHVVNNELMFCVNCGLPHLFHYYYSKPLRLGVHVVCLLARVLECFMKFDGSFSFAYNFTQGGLGD